MKWEELKEKIEAIVDATSVREVLDALEEVCHEKAEHVRSNWQDEGLAIAWNLAGKYVTHGVNKLPKVPGIEGPK